MIYRRASIKIGGIFFARANRFLTEQADRLDKGCGCRIVMNISDEQTEYQINDRLSFMRFLGIELKDKVPDAKTICLFKERLIEAKVTEKLKS